MNAAADVSPLIDIDMAREIATAQVGPLGAVLDLPILAATGHVCARDVLATSAMPFFTNSAVDGFALRLSDLTEAGQTLPICATIAAGADGSAPLPPGAAARIFTGAPVPEGADTVVALEDVIQTADAVRFPRLPKSGENVRLAGSDQPQGACLLARGTRIAPQHVGLLAANGIVRLSVIRKPRVAVLSTGDELARQTTRRQGQIFDANRPMLMALALAAGCEVVDAGVMPDEVGPLAARLADLAMSSDLVLSSGGVSVGGRDPLRPAFAAAGGQMAAWRVAVKPGKPVMFGRIGTTAFTGLPGNPMAAFVGFHLFVLPQIAGLTGKTPVPFAPLRGRLVTSWRHRPGRQEVVPVRCLGTDGTGLSLLEPLGHGVSATLFPLAMADGLAVVPAQSDGVAEGEVLAWQPFCAGV